LPVAVEDERRRGNWKVITTVLSQAKKHDLAAIEDQQMYIENYCVVKFQGI
jgi:hypothetical protein